MRPSGRATDALRPVTIETGVTRHAEGSCLIRMGDTHVLCTASLEETVPPFLRKTGLGWVTAEYGMLPRSTTTRTRREAAAGKQSGRTQEIQRLIGRSLRAGIDRVALGERQITVDCDVIQADGGTRCASITGGWVALRLAVNGLLKAGAIKSDPLTAHVAAVSCGIYGGQPVLDLDYAEDSAAGTDANFVMTGELGLIEVQGSAEGATFSRAQFDDADRPRREGRRRAGRGAEGGGGMTRRFDGRRLVVATHNARQARGDRGAARALSGRGGLGRGRSGLPEPAETEETFVGNARIKAHAAARASGLPALADDSRDRGRRARRRARRPYRRLGRDAGRAATSCMAMTRTWAALEAGARARAADGAVPLHAGAGLAGRARRGLRGRRRGPLRLADARRPRVTATTRCSCPTAHDADLR